MFEELFTGQPIESAGGDKAQRHVAKQRRQLDRVHDYFARRGMSRLSTARAIAIELAVKSEFRTVTVADVYDEFVRRFGTKAWLGETGTTHWTGAIFRLQQQWECTGVGPSPLNHSYDNRIWRLREE